MARIVYLACISLCALHGVSAIKGKLASFHVAPDDRRVAGEWLALLSKEAQSCHTTSFDIEKTFPGVTVKDSYEVGRVRALRILASDEDAEKLRPHPDITVIESNNLIHAMSGCQMQETGSELWGLSRIARRDLPLDYEDAHYSYDSDSAGQGVDVYVMDSGINIAHKDFEGRAVVGFTASDLAEEGDDDLNGHGTHVAGTVGGKKYGVAKSSKLISVKVTNKDGSGSAAGTAEGLVYTCNDFAKKAEINTKKKRKAVLNASLGLGQADEGYAIAEAMINECADQGLTMVVAAGNDDQDACNDFPARLSSVITVGASGDADQLASFSNFGPCVEIVAPGVGIKSAWIGNDTATSTIQGTSMAAPHVSGIIARYMSEIDEELNPHEVKSLLLSSSSLGKIKREDHRVSTPDRLAYAPCRLTEIISTEEETGSRTGAADVLTYIMFPMAIIVFIVAMVIAVEKVMPWIRDLISKEDVPSVPYVERSHELSSTA